MNDWRLKLLRKLERVRAKQRQMPRISLGRRRASQGLPIVANIQLILLEEPKE
jgi:hypothetical protein